MGRDENGTLARLKAHRSERLEPTLARHGGRLVKLTGDGALAEFPSAVDALGAAIEFQQAMVEANHEQPDDTRIVFRIGLHLGDLIVDGDDLYGDGVNVAARLEAEALPGGIVISGDVHNAVTGRLKATFDDLGTLSLKNIERPVQAFAVKWEAANWKAPTSAAPIVVPVPAADAPLALPDKPSIAVLAFQNMSGDPEQDYFADGMVEDIITGLSRNKALFVIARNSSFAYKGKSPDIRQVGRELGVRYVLEGSVRKAGNRVRITGQLIDAADGTHIWADRFDGELDDIFDLQDRVTSSVIGGIFPTLDAVEMERARRKTGNLQAYDLYMRSLAATYRFTCESLTEALVHAREAVVLDPNFALGHAAIAYAHLAYSTFYRVAYLAEDIEEGVRAARRGLALDTNDARVLTYCGQSLLVLAKRIGEGAAHLDRAVKLDPNFALAWSLRGNSKILIGEPEQAFGDLERALRLSPLDTMKFFTLHLLARAYFVCDRYDEAATTAAESVRLSPNHPGGHVTLMAANALAERLDVAREACAACLTLNPRMSIASIKAISLLRPHHLAKLVGALRLAGLPE